MRNQRKRKDRPNLLEKRGGASGGGGAGGGATGRKNVKDALDTMDDRKVLPDKVDTFDKIFADVGDIVNPDMMTPQLFKLTREALNLGPNAPIPDQVSPTQAAAILRKIARASNFNIAKSELNYYFD